jgi:hypothetical protein
VVIKKIKKILKKNIKKKNYINTHIHRPMINFWGYYCAGVFVVGRQLGRVVLVSCIVLVGIFASGAWGAMVKDPGSPVWTDHIHRLNFGMAAYKLQRACVADGYWYHTFTFSLPPRVSDEDFNGTRAERTNCTGDCLRIEGLFNTTTALTIGVRRSIKGMVDKIYDLLPDLWSVRRN